MTAHPTDGKYHTTWIAAASIGVAAAVMGIKYLAYLRTGSAALYSDALESIVNVMTAIAALVAIRVSVRPADRRHQFGHHKAEYFSAVLEGALIIVAAVLMLREAWDAVLRPRVLTEIATGLAISVAAAVINAIWSWCLIVFGGRMRSPALAADGRHLALDVATSVVVVVGLVLATITGWRLMDAALAAVMAAYILYVGWRLMRESMSGLMDEAVTADVSRRIREVIRDNSTGAIEVHDLRSRSAGRATFIEFHLVVPGAMTVAEAHGICDRLEAAIKREVDGAEVLVHVEPEAEARHRGVVVLSADRPEG